MKQRWTTDWGRVEGKWSILRLFSFFFHLENIPSSFVPLRYIWTAGEKLGLKEVTRTKSHFYKRGPFIFPPKHTEALHLSPGPPLSWILLYVNSMYLRRLEGNTASARDSEMLNFSLLTKGERPRLAPWVLDQQNRDFCSTEGSLFQPLTTPTHPTSILLTHPCGYISGAV